MLERVRTGMAGKARSVDSPRLEDLPQIVTFDFIKTHFGDEQLKIYTQILEREGNFWKKRTFARTPYIVQH